MNIPNLTDRVDPIVESTIRDIYSQLNQQASDLAATRAGIKPPPTASQIASALSVAGTNPLNVTGLVGLLSQPQNARVTNNTSAPTPGNPQAQNGTLFTINNQLYYYQNGQAIAIESIAVVLYDTHANRANYPAGNYVKGTLYYETDRQVLYVDSGSAWVYALGTMGNSYSSRPTDLGTGDANFLFLADDWTVYFRWTGTSWSYESGIYYAPIASRPTPSSTDNGVLFFAADWTVLYRWTGTVWLYESGIYSAPTGSRPSSLTTNDTDFLFIDTTLKLLEQWNGTAWVIISPAPTTLVLAYKDELGNYTLTASDFQVVSTNSATAIFDLPDATTVPGQVYAIKNSSTSTSTLTVDAFSGQTIDGNSAFSFAPTEGFIIASDGSTNWNVLAVTRLSSSSGAWSSFTPSTGNLSSVGSYDCAAIQIGKNGYARLAFTGTVVSNAPVSFTVPFAFKSTNEVVSFYLFSSGGSYISFGTCTVSGTTLTTTVNLTSGNTYEFRALFVYETA